MTPRARVVLIALAVVALVVAFVVAGGSGGDDNSASTAPTTTASPTTSAPSAPAGATTAPTVTTPAEPPTPVVRVVGGKPQGGVKRLTFAKGDTVRFTVRSDVADEIHVHGYDFKKDVPAGGSVTFAFKATIDGRFDVELEGRGEQIALLEVTP